MMHFGYNNRKPDYFIDGVNLEHVTEEKDLGIIINELAIVTTSRKNKAQAIVTCSYRVSGVSHRRTQDFTMGGG